MSDDRSEFARGVEAYQAKNFDLARDQFLKLDQNNSAVQLNLALTYGALKQPGLAVAHFRAAEELTGHTSQSEAVAKALQLTDGNQNYSFLGTLNQKVLMDVSLWQLCALSSVLLFASLWLFLRRKVKSSAIGFYPIIFGLLFLVIGSLAGAKSLAQKQIRGTITDENVGLFVEADSQSPQLMTIPQGQYVVVEDTGPEWTRIQLEGVAEGYVKTNQLYVRGGHP